MSTPGAYPGLAALLWTVRDQLEAVLYRLVVVRLIVTDGSPRWLPRADAELDEALEQLRAAEVLRASEVDAIVSRGGGPDSLAALAATAPEPWADVLEDHRAALRLLVTEIDAAAAENRQVIQTALRRFRMPARLSGRPVRDDEAIMVMAAYRAALATTESVAQLSLHDFLD